MQTLRMQPGLRARGPWVAGAAALLLHAALLSFGVPRGEAHAGAHGGGAPAAVRLLPAPAATTGRLEAAAPGPEPAMVEPLPKGRAVTVARVANALPAAAVEDEYVDASRLDTSPSPLGEIDIAAPEGYGRPAAYHGTLLLFIGPDGTVMRIAVEHSDLPPAFEAEARAAFAAARFSPCRIGGLPVGAKLRVEVGFETDPAAR